MNTSLPDDDTAIATLPDDPTIDTPLVVTLDELRAYELNPRLTRNPLYDDIKASIRMRGLDAPPAITRRPGEDVYLIRNGGNTRLAILRELWEETGHERFFRLTCLFRPWPERGEIITLTGHLAENELHGSLTFIERALTVEKAHELYEQESGHALSQSELARCLTADGYPVPQSHISRMQDAVRYLLPAIPTLLHDGLGRHKIEKLAALRTTGQYIWEQHTAHLNPSIDFIALFQQVLSGFDSVTEALSLDRIQDELIGQMAVQLETDYDLLALDFNEPELCQSVDEAPSAVPILPLTQTVSGESRRMSPPTTPRLQAIQRLVAQHTGEAVPEVAEPIPQAMQPIPVSDNGSDSIPAVQDTELARQSADLLRAHIAQCARDIAAEAGVDKHVSACQEGIGFTCTECSEQTPFACAVLRLLNALAESYPGMTRTQHADDTPDNPMPADLFSILLWNRSGIHASNRLSDASLDTLLQIIRLARTLLDQ